MFALLLLLYKNKEQRHLNTQGRLHQQLRKDPVKGLTQLQFPVCCTLYNKLKNLDYIIKKFAHHFK